MLSGDGVIITHIYSFWIGTYIYFWDGWDMTGDAFFLLVWFKMLGMTHLHVDEVSGHCPYMTDSYNSFHEGIWSHDRKQFKPGQKHLNLLPSSENFWRGRASNTLNLVSWQSSLTHTITGFSLLLFVFKLFTQKMLLWSLYF